MITAIVPFRVSDQDLTCEIQYDEDAYPLALDFVFDENEEVLWTIGRDLLLSGMDSDQWVGEGMVSVRRDNHNTITMVLRSYEDSCPATLHFPRKSLLAFLTYTYTLVNAGTEFDHFDWEEFDAERTEWQKD